MFICFDIFPLFISWQFLTNNWKRYKYASNSLLCSHSLCPPQWCTESVRTLLGHFSGHGWARERKDGSRKKSWCSLSMACLEERSIFIHFDAAFFENNICGKAKFSIVWRQKHGEPTSVFAQALGPSQATASTGLKLQYSKCKRSVILWKSPIQFPVCMIVDDWEVQLLSDFRIKCNWTIHSFQELVAKIMFWWPYIYQICSVSVFCRLFYISATSWAFLIINVFPLEKNAENNVIMLLGIKNHVILSLDYFPSHEFVLLKTWYLFSNKWYHAALYHTMSRWGEMNWGDSQLQ